MYAMHRGHYQKIIYYKKLEVPVLIVRYVNNENIFYIKWAHEIDLFYAKKGAKTFSVNFSEKNKWTDQTPCKISSSIKKAALIKKGQFFFPIPIRLNIKYSEIKGLSKAILTSKLRAYP